VARSDGQLLTSLLRDVSRSFFLTLRVLPSGIRRPIGLAYLLARATDTIADTELVSVEERLTALTALRDRILGTRGEAVLFSRLAEAQTGAGSEAERTLLLRIEEAIVVLGTLDGFEQEQIRRVLTTITSGQELDLRRFGHAGKGTVLALPDAAALDDYTHRVAGCVGDFWTRLCRARLFPNAALDETAFLRDGERFGRGLQLVNILRDLPRDLQAGRCYLPADELSAVGLVPADLLGAANRPRLAPVYGRWLEVAGGHLEAGWRYTRTIPGGQIRLRLGCAWPVLIGMRTLQGLKTANPLDPGVRVKVSRGEVRDIIWATCWRLPWRRSWDGLDGWAQRGP
jgi:farnesyl-diphosphate farnesyltransferase